MPKLPNAYAGAKPVPPSAAGPIRLRVADALVALETATAGDATPAMAAWLADPAAVDGLNAATLPGVEELRRYIASFDNNRRNLAMVRLAASRRPVGLAMFDIDPRHLNASFHLLIGEPSARTGLVAVSAVDLLLTHLFEKRGAEKVTIEPLSRNRAAVRLCERFGFRKEGELKGHRRDARSGERLDQLIFGVSRAEYAAWREAGKDPRAAMVGARP